MTAFKALDPKVNTAEEALVLLRQLAENGAPAEVLRDFIRRACKHLAVDSRNGENTTVAPPVPETYLG